MRGYPWLEQYDEGVPSTLIPYPECTLLEFVAQTTLLRPRHDAILFRGARLSYEQLSRLSDAFAAALVELGVRPGDRIALLLPNCPQFLIAELGAWKAGAIVVPLDPLSPAEELAGPLASTGAVGAVVLSPYYAKLKAVQPRTALRWVVSTGIKEYLPRMSRVIFTLARQRREGHRVVPELGDHAFSTLLVRGRRAPRSEVRVTPDMPAVILSSGGTSGTPKGVLGLHRHLVAAALQLRSWVKRALVDWEDVHLLPLPLFHAYGLAGGQGLALVSHGTIALVPNPHDVGDVVRTIDVEQPTFLCGVPSLFNALVAHPDVRSRAVDFSSIRLAVASGAPLPAETRRRFEEATGSRLIEAYSLTEAQMACVASPIRGRTKPGAVGVPLPDVEVRIVDAESGAWPMTTGEVGEILLRAPQLMAEYWNAPEETLPVVRPHGDGGPWLHTGDLGYLDQEGYLFVVDRRKDLIKSSGFQVWPREIEDVIARHPDVIEVGVAGVPDPGRGEAPKAWVVARSGATVTADDLLALCREHLAPYKVPAAIAFRAELPKTMVGRVLRRALVAQDGAAGAGADADTAAASR